MRVTALGHAGLKVETSSASLLLDPWFSPEGAFQGSWFQFPDNSHLMPAITEGVTAVVISHEHLDHVDPWFLARVPRHVPVIVPRYPSSSLRQKILASGRRTIVEAAQWEAVDIAGDTSVYFVSEPPMNHDSAIIVRGDGRTLLDVNDARLFPMQFRQIRRREGGVIDMCAFQGAGASWYPMCYSYPPERAQLLSARKRKAKLAYCLRLMRLVEPVVGFPFAGPPAFLDPDLFHHNAESEGGVFPDQQQVADWLARRGAGNTTVLLPGDSWNLHDRRRLADAHWDGFSYSDRWPYLERYAERRAVHLADVLARHPFPTATLWDDFSDYFHDLLDMSPYFNEKIGMRVGFDVTGAGGGRWSVDFRRDRRGVYQELDTCGYVFRFESRWLPPLLDGSVPWEDFLLSLRFEAHRDPDLYNDHLLGLLKFADSACLDAVEAFESAPASDERITVHSEGRDYHVQRYCPHAGSDLLTTGEVLPGGILRCLAHHYEFDLETGECLTGTCSPLRVAAGDRIAIGRR